MQTTHNNKIHGFPPGSQFALRCRTMARSKKSIKSIAAQVVTRAPIRTTPKKQRTGRKDIKTPRKDITLRAEAITRGGPLTKSAFALLKQDFPDENLKWNFVRKQLNFYRQQIEQSVPTAAVEWGRKRKHCGRQAIKFTPEVAQLLIDVNNRHWGQLSFKRLAGKLAELDIDVTPMTIRKWCLELGMVRRRRYIKPKLTLTHRVNRLEFVLIQINKRTAEFTTLEDTVHGDEKWFFLMKDGQVCRVFPDKNGKHKVPAAPKVFHKSRMPKIMFLAVCAKPRNEYGFDGRIGLWSFTLERFAKRSDIRTGTVVGESLMLEDVSVDARALVSAQICPRIIDILRQNFALAWSIICLAMLELSRYFARICSCFDTLILNNGVQGAICGS